MAGYEPISPEKVSCFSTVNHIPQLNINAPIQNHNKGSTLSNPLELWQALFVYNLIIINLSAMSQPQPEDDDPEHCPMPEVIINPFQYRQPVHPQSIPIEREIKTWIESIFFTNKKIDVQTKTAIYNTNMQHKYFQHSSCSIVYSIIRDTIEEIVSKLRSIIDSSFTTLRGSKPMSKLSQTSSSWELNWIQFKNQRDQISCKNIYGPISNQFINWYKYLHCNAEQVCQLWTAVYQFIPVKDLPRDSFDKAIHELILNKFTEDGQIFSPKSMLPVVSFAQKCKFVNVDQDGSLKRMDLTRFKEDQLAINFAKANGKKIVQSTQKGNCSQPKPPKKEEKGKMSEEKGKTSEEIKSEEKGKTGEENARQGERYSVDPKQLERWKKSKLINQDIIEEIRNQYLNSKKITEEMKEKVEDICSFFELTNDPKEPASQDDQQMTFMKRLGIDPEDSSQEDDLNDIEYDEREDLIDENADIQIQQPLSYKKEIDILAKLSEQAGFDDLSDPTADLVFKDDGFLTPHEFDIEKQINSSAPFELMEEDEELTMEISRRFTNHAETKQGKQKDMPRKNEDGHTCASHKNVEKSRKRISKHTEKEKEKDKKDHSKCCLEEQKQKWQKYRKQLEREKEELMLKVERFMKEKEMDTNLYRSIASGQLANNCMKGNKNCIRHTHQIKHFDKCRGDHRHHDENMLLYTKEELEKHGKECLSRLVNHDSTILSDEQSTMEANSSSQESRLEDLNEEKKMSKRQQKLRKKIEREMKQFKSKESECMNPYQDSQTLSEEQAQLTNFLENLNISKGNRVSWNIEEAQLERWKNKLQLIREKEAKDCVVQEMSPAKQSKKKKKKHR